MYIYIYRCVYTMVYGLMYVCVYICVCLLLIYLRAYRERGIDSMCFHVDMSIDMYAVVCMFTIPDQQPHQGTVEHACQG